MMVLSDGGVRWLVFHQKTTESTIQASTKPFQDSFSNSYPWLKCNLPKPDPMLMVSAESSYFS